MATTNEQGKGGQGNTETPKPGETAAPAAAGEQGKGGEQKPGEQGKGGEAAKAPEQTGTETQQKPGEQGKGKEGDTGKGEKKAPAKYELKVPKDSTLDADDVATIETLARENDWDNDTAQAILENHNDTLVAQSAKFLETTTADKEYGGEKLPATQARAKAVIDLVRPASHPRAKAFRALLDKSGYGNNIEVISFLADLGKMTEEDGVTVGAGGGGSKTKTVEETLYDKS